MRHVRFETDRDLAVITLDSADSGTNTLTIDMLDEFDEVLEQLEHSPAITTAVLIGGKPSGFMHGFDVEGFTQFKTRDEAERVIRVGQRRFNRLAELETPVVAALHGPVVGSGLELALACHYRLATPDATTLLALPAVTLGLLPALGGTQRLPRLVGLERALEMLLTGRSVSAEEARDMGLVDALKGAADLLEEAKRTARALARGEGTPRRLSASDAFAQPQLYQTFSQRVEARSQGNYPAPEKIIECVRVGQEEDISRGLEQEAVSFGELLFSPQARALIHLSRAKRACEVNLYRDAPREVRTIGVLGAGLMGSGIAQVSAQSGYAVVLKDRSLELVEKGIQAAERNLSRTSGLREADRQRILSAIHPAQDYAALAEADLVIEAVPEVLELKQQILRDSKAVCKDSVIFASNTSSIPVTKIAQASRQPERVLGMHYFSPAHKMPLLEIVKTEQTSPEVLATAFAVGRAQGKTIIVVADSPSFYTTRILAVYLNEALTLLQEGASVAQIDRVMKRFGFPVGPLVLFDEIGIDVGVKILDVMAPLFEARNLTLSQAGHAMLEAGYEGRKNKRGFYCYQSGSKTKEVDETIDAFFEAEGRNVSGDEVRDRLAFIMTNEALHCLQEGVLASPRDGDVGAVLGLGFPSYTGGPFWWCDQQGLGEVRRKLERLADRCGARFTPAECLQDLVKGNKSFYETP